MVRFRSYSLPIGVVAGILALIFTGEPEISRLWFAVWSLN